MILLLTAGVSARGIVSPSGLSAAATTYTVAFEETGLPSGHSWTVIFNGVTGSSSTAIIKFTGISSGSYSWSVTSPLAGTTGVQYITSQTSGSMSVPDQITQWIVFQKQYEVSFAVSPTSAGYTSPGSTTWFDAGTVFVITAIPYTGYSFSAWKTSTSALAISVTSVASTMITVGATGTITADFKQLSYTVTFSEVGVPSGDSWSIDFNGAVSSATAPSNIAIKSITSNDYSWNAPAIPVATGVDYAAAANGGTLYGDMYVPFQTLQVVVYTEQFEVAFAVPSGDGYTSPESTTYYTAGTNLAITATPYSGYVFSEWSSNTASISIASATSSATNATIRGTGTLSADFTSGSPSCTTCTVTFTEIGLPKSTDWGVYWNGSYYATTTPTLTIPGQIAGDYYWEATTPIYGGSFTVSYAASPDAGYLYLPYSTSQVIVFTEQVWVSVVITPSTSSGSTNPYYGAWYPVGSQLAIAAEESTSFEWTFSKWSISTTSDKIASASAESTSITLKAPATITATFVQPTHTVTFREFGLPTSKTWGIEFNSVDYLTDSTTLVLSGVPTGSWYWYVLEPVSGASNGIEYTPTQTSDYVTVPTQTYQALAFQEQFYLTVGLTPSGAGSTSPYGAAWYLDGTILAISAINSTGSFTSWSSTSTSIVIASASSASTTVSIGGTGIVTAKFS